MTGLNDVCIRIINGENEAVKELFSDQRINQIVESAIRRIKNKNPEYHLGLLKRQARYEIWDEIQRNYCPARDPSKGDNLVLKFVLSITYKKLLNFIREDKKLRWTSNGYQHKMVKVSMDSTDVDPSCSKGLHEIIPTDDPAIDETIITRQETELVQKALTYSVKSGKMKEIENFIILLRFKENLSYQQIQKVLWNQFELEASSGWIAGCARNGMNVLKKVLERFIIERKDDQ